MRVFSQQSYTNIMISSLLYRFRLKYPNLFLSHKHWLMTLTAMYFPSETLARVLLRKWKSARTPSSSWPCSWPITGYLYTSWIKESFCVYAVTAWQENLAAHCWMSVNYGNEIHLCFIQCFHTFNIHQGCYSTLRMCLRFLFTVSSFPSNHILT